MLSMLRIDVQFARNAAHFLAAAREVRHHENLLLVQQWLSSFLPPVGRTWKEMLHIKKDGGHVDAKDSS
jgi:hypothetical protein